MATTGRYLASTKNVATIFQKMQHGVPPEKFNVDHLKAIGFGGSNDRAVVPLLKDLGFLSTDGTPTQRYRDYRDTARSRAVMATALRESYPDLFVINENLSKSDREAIIGRFKSIHDSSDVVAEHQARTFLALLDQADLSAKQPSPATSVVDNEEASLEHSSNGTPASCNRHRPHFAMPLAYRFEVQLPATKDVEVFRAIFRAMKEELFDD